MNLAPPSDPHHTASVLAWWPTGGRAAPPTPARTLSHVPALTMRSGPWTADEVTYLTQRWPTPEPTRWICKVLRRTPESVQKKAAKLGLHRPHGKVDVLASL